MTFWYWFWMVVIAIIVAWVKIKGNEMKQYQSVEEYKYHKRQFYKLIKEAMREEVKP